MTQRTIQIAKNCILMQVPVAIENPYQSMIWETMEFKNSMNIPGVVSTRIDFCQYGESHHKKTNIVSFGYPSMEARARTCSGKGGLCSRTGKPHDLLTGVVECPLDQLHLLPKSSRAKLLKPQPMAQAANLARRGP